MTTQILIKIISEDFKLGEHPIEQLCEHPRHIAVGTAIFFRLEGGR